MQLLHGFEDVSTSVTNTDNIGITGDLTYSGSSGFTTGKLNDGHVTAGGSKLSSSASTDFNGDSDELSYFNLQKYMNRHFHSSKSKEEDVTSE